jgi:hypothetical protein
MGDSFADATIMSTITYDGLMGGDLDESEIPNEGYEPHYVFDGDTKSESSYPLVDGDGNLRRGNVGAAWELYGQSEDDQFLLDVLEKANEAFADEDGMSAPIPMDSLAEAMADTDTMTDATNTDGSTDSPTDPTEFYDSEPDVETLADDFTAVASLVDAKEGLETEVEELRDSLHEYERTEFRDRAERLAELTNRDVDTLVESFDDGEMTFDDLDAKIEVAEDALATTSATGVTATDSNSDSDEGGDGREFDSNVVTDPTFAADDDIDTTERGKRDLSSVR